MRATYRTLLLKGDFNPKAVSKLMGHAQEIITMDVYGDNANIIPEEVPELQTSMEEVLPQADDPENKVRDILIDVDAFISTPESDTKNPH